MISPLFILLALPLMGLLAITFRAPARLTTLLVCAANVLLVVGCVLQEFLKVKSHQILSADFLWMQSIPWGNFPGLGAVNFTVGVDGISFPLVILTVVVALAAVLVTPFKVERERLFYGNILLVIFGALGAFVSLDLFFLYIFHEVALIPSFLLIGMWGYGPRRVYVSYQTTIYLLAGSLAILIGFLILLNAMPPMQRTTDLVALREWFLNEPLNLNTQIQLCAWLFIGFGILVGLFPFHSWAPSAYATAPTGLAMLHAGVLKKFGIYGLLRIVLPLFPLTPQGFTLGEGLVTILIAGNLLVIGWVTLAQRRLDHMLGFSSVMHMGYLFLGLFAASQLSLSGVVLLMVGHGLSVSGLFAVNGLLREKVAEGEMARLGGLAKYFPFLGFAFVIFALASLGLPGLANFPGEILIFFGSWKSYPLLTTVALFGVVLSSIYLLRAVKRVFFGPSASAMITDIAFTASSKLGILILLIGVLGLGFLPGLWSQKASVSLAHWLGRDITKVAVEKVRTF